MTSLTVLQQAVLEQRERRPTLSHEAHVEQVARTFGLTPGDVETQLGRAFDPLPPAEGTTAELTARDAASVRATYTGARRGGHTHYRSVRLAAKRAGITQAVAEAVLNATEEAA